jgi:hypothetical protein
MERKYILMVKSCKKFALVLLLFLCWNSLQAQVNHLFSEVSIETDSSRFLLSKDTVQLQGEKALYFTYSQDDELCRVILTPQQGVFLDKYKIQETSDYQILDSLYALTDGRWCVKLRMKNLTQSNFLALRFLFNSEKGWVNAGELRLLPCTQTSASVNFTSDELFIGEEKVYELVTNNVANIRINSEWKKADGINYRFEERNGVIMLHLQPVSLGKTQLSLSLQIYKPWLNEKRELVYQLPLNSHSFVVKQSRLAFLNTDNKELTYDEKSKTSGIEIQIDNHRLLQLNKTYRVEAQEEKGGALIGELFTRNNLANDKILCVFRPYNYHYQRDGYLYIKDGDDAKFVTNFNISPKATIQKISILRKGADWNESLQLFPGETVLVRVEGESLHKARFSFEDLIDLSTDSLTRNDKMAEYKLKVPMSITKRKLLVFNNKEQTGFSLQIKEYQLPHNFDYIYVDYGDKSKRLSSMRGTSFFTESIRDVTFSFLLDKIDTDEKMYGVQYVDVDVKIIGDKGEILEIQKIENLTLVPGRTSPRYAMYDAKGATIGELSLNSFISKKTYDLRSFSRIQLTFSNKKDKYNGEGFTKTIEIVPAEYTRLDIDVSFPAGLLIRKQGDDGYGNFGGVSLAMIAQLSFLEKDKVSVYKPYKVGVGFIALNAFNFSNSNTDRDLGIVAIGSLYPTRAEAKLRFPLYFGGGYLLSQKKFFWLIGPGIQVNF